MPLDSFYHFHVSDLQIFQQAQPIKKKKYVQAYMIEMVTTLENSKLVKKKKSFIPLTYANSQKLTRNSFDNGSSIVTRQDSIP
jgi:hypothetical protein